MARGKVGEAVIEAVSDTDGFERDLEKGVKDAVTEASKGGNWDPLVQAGRTAGGQAGTEFVRQFTLDARGRLHDERGRFVSLFGRGFGPIAFDVGSDFLSRFLAGFASGARFAPFAGTLLRGASSFLNVFTTLGAPGLLGGLASFSILIGVLVVAIPLLTSALFALGSALVSLVGLVGALPGLFTGVLATLAPLIIAFQGFGEAVGAAASGDLEKFNEALKNLTPSARGVAREVQALMPFFTDMRKTVQEAFFSQAAGGITRFFGAAGSTLTGGLANVAFTLGKIFSMVAAFGAQPETVNFLARLFDSVTTGLSTGGPVIIRFLEAMVAIADASLPVLSVFFATLGAGVDRFSAFLQGAAADGSFAAFLQDAFDILFGIFGVVGQLVELFGAAFGTDEMRDATKEFFADLERILADITAWFQSPDGQEFLENMATLARDFWNVMDTLVLPVVRELFLMFAAFLELLDKVGNAMDRIFGNKDVKFKSFPASGLGLPGFDRGGITDGLSLAHANEAILPLDDPVRAREVASDPRVMDVLGGGTGDTVVYAVFDGEPFQARIVRTTRKAMAGASRQLAQKPRVGVA